jgi:hypothetical protein
MKKAIQTILSEFGLQVSKSITDSRNTTLTIGEIACNAQIKPILVNLPLNLGRANGLPMYQAPYSLLVSKIYNKDNELLALQSLLTTYLKHLRNMSASDLMGLKPRECIALDTEPPRALLFPWSDASLTEHRAMIINGFCKEAQREGLVYKSDSMDMSDRWIQIHAAQHSCRLLRVRDSMIKNGYRRHNGNDGDSCGAILIHNNGKYCWVNGKGIHRMCVAHALGFEAIPVRVTKIVRRCDVRYWPGVVSGMFSRETALRVFDRLIEGEAPPRHTLMLQSINTL